MRVPWWGVLSAAAAPVLLIGGWTLAAARQPGTFDPVRGTISALAAYGATDRWVMTTALAGLGLCHLTTALALRPAARAGRLVLAAGGAATVGVAVFPLPRQGPSTAHALCAGAALLALAVWPLAAARRAPGAPAVLRPTTCWAAEAALLGLVGWFGVELGPGVRTGLAERAAAGAQALWPLAVVISVRRAQHGRRTSGPAGIGSREAR